MNPRTATLALALTAAGLAGCAQNPTSGHAHAGHGHGGHGHQPYAGLQDRTIKALSAQQVADLRAGRGMSMALAAELNGYPGPMHVLELAAPLSLTDAQRARTQALFERMQGEARAAGETLLAAETALDDLFRQRRVTPESLAQATRRAAIAQGVVRETHLRYHLEMIDVLSPEQVAAYDRLRGYRR